MSEEKNQEAALPIAYRVSLYLVGGDKREIDMVAAWKGDTESGSFHCSQFPDGRSIGYASGTWEHYEIEVISPEVVREFLEQVSREHLESVQSEKGSE